MKSQDNVDLEPSLSILPLTQKSHYSLHGCSQFLFDKNIRNMRKSMILSVNDGITEHSNAEV